MNVLIAVDGSSESMKALQTAAYLLRPARRHVDLLSVAPEFRDPSVPLSPGWERERQRLVDRASRILKKTAASIPWKDGSVNCVTEIGSPSGLIVDKAADHDLVVVGAKGRGSSGEFGLGPVASRVVEHSAAPVLVGRTIHSEEGSRILVAVDGSNASLLAVETLDSLFDLNSAEICLLHVVETPWLHLRLEEEGIPLSESDGDSRAEEEMEAELIRAGEIVLETARERLRSLHASVETCIDHGNPANEILSEAERGQYDLVVVGASGSSDVKHRMLGSVSFKVAWNAPCSVLIARELEQVA